MVPLETITAPEFEAKVKTGTKLFFTVVGTFAQDRSDLIKPDSLNDPEAREKVEETIARFLANRFIVIPPTDTTP